MKVAILIYPGVEEMDAFAPFEVLQAAGNLGAVVETTLATVGDPAPLRMAHGAIVTPHERFANADLLIVPGGGWANRAPAGAWVEAQNPQTLAIIRQVHDADNPVAGICTGAMLMSHAGLLNGRPATTHHSAIEDLKAAGATITEARVVDAGDVLTCGGVTSGLDLALWIVERYFGRDIAAGTETYLEYERRGTVWRASS